LIMPQRLSRRPVPALLALSLRVGAILKAHSLTHVSAGQLSLLGGHVSMAPALQKLYPVQVLLAVQIFSVPQVFPPFPVHASVAHLLASEQ